MTMLDKISMKIAWLLPKSIVYWCAIRLGCHATQNEWSNEVVPDLNFVDALKRWPYK